MKTLAPEIQNPHRSICVTWYKDIWESGGSIWPKNKELYVCVEKGKIAGVFMFTERPDKTYREIFQGEWLNEKPYGTMHRMASSGIQKGVSSFCLDWCFKQCGNVKGDTHEDNYVMQKVFEKNGFRRCGIIYVEDGTPRIAYQREN